MSAFEVKGRLIVKYATQQVTEKFRKREFVLEIANGQYFEQIKFQLTQDKCDQLDQYREGDNINVSFNLRGKPYTNKNGEVIYYTNLDAWRLQSAAENTSKATETMPPPDDTFTYKDADDSAILPF